MKQFAKKYMANIYMTGIVIVVLLIFYFIVPTLLKWFLPFILAYLIAYLTNPLVTFFEKKLRIPRKIASGITILLTLLFIGSLLTLIIYRIIYELRDLAVQLPKIIEGLPEQFNALMNKGIKIYINLNLPPDATQFINNVGNTIKNNLSDWIPNILKPLLTGSKNFAANFAIALPSILVFIIVLVISTFFISSDKAFISRYLRRQIPDDILDRMISIKNDLIGALLGYVRAQCILMSITFVEVSIGFLIIGVNYAIILALFVSLIDAFPVLGTGTILIPWAVWSFISGDYLKGLSLLILYGIVLLVRQLLEPKILGDQIGLYPLVTLMSMYVGIHIFGVAGVLMGPVTILILKNLYKAGIFKKFKD